MRKIYSFMLALFATLCVGTLSAKTTADTLSFTLNVDHPEAIEVMVSDYVNETIIPVVKGDNTIKVPSVAWGGYANVYVTVQDGWGIASIDHNLPETDPDYDYTPTFYGENGEWSLYVSGACAGLTYTVVSYDLSAARSDSLLVWIDSKSGANLAYAAGNTISLKDSIWNVVRFSSDSALKDIPLQVNPIGNVYQVKLNGKVLPLTPGMGYWNPDYYSLAGAVNGDSVEIHVNAPADLTYPVIFKFAEPEMKAALDSVYVGEEKVEYHDTINVTWGKSIQVYFNTIGYAITINDNQFYGSAYNNTITDTLVLNIAAIAYHDFNVTLKVHNPNCVAVNCYINGNYTTLTDLKDGVDTVLTLSSKQPLMMVRKNSDCKVDSVLVNGKKELNYSQFTCNDNSVIEIFADSVRRTLDLMLYVEDASAFSYTSFQNGSYKNMLPGDGKLHAGYTPIKFDESDNDFYIYISPKPVYYQNDSLIDLGYMSSCYPTFANGDVFKIFADTAEVYTVGFYFAEGATVTNVTKDRIVAVDKNFFTVLQGTEVSFETTATVTVNDTVATAVDGVYTLVIDTNTTIVVGDLELNLVSCAVANAAAKGESVALNEVVVAYAAPSDNYFIQDKEGWTLLYQKNAGLKAGDRITGIMGKVDIYNGLPEVKPSSTDWAVISGEAPAPALQNDSITAKDINHFIKLDSVYLSGAFTSDNNYTLMGIWKGDTITIYDKYKTNNTFADGKYYVVGIVSVYKNNLQLNFISATPMPSIANTVENPYTIAEAIELTKAGDALEDTVFVIGVVKNIGTTDANIQKYGNVDVYLTQDTLEYQFRYMLNVGGEKFANIDEVNSTFTSGDTLIAKGTLTYYAAKDRYQLNQYCQLVEVRKAPVEPEPEPEIAQYQLHGSWVENWGGPKLEIAEDQATATATVEMNAGNYGFGIKQIDAAGAQIAWLWTANVEGDTFTREANAFTFIKQETIDNKDNGKNPTLAADVDGVYTFVWKYADNTLTITFPAKPEGIFNTTVDGQAEKFVRDGQLIIRMNGVEYNVLGAKIQ